MASYYADKTLGSDGGTGEIGDPWETINKVNISSFNPNDNVYFKKGEGWREQLTFPSSGTEGNVITIGAYGSGDDPIINGSDIATGWTLDAGNIWKKTGITYQPKIVIFDGTIGVYQTAKGNLASAGHWYWDDGEDTLYTYSTTDPDSAYSIIEIGGANRSICIYLNGNDYLTIQDLELYGARGTAVTYNSNTNIILKDSEINAIGKFAFFNASDSSYLLFQNLHIHNITVEDAFYIRSYATDSHHITIEHCNIHDFAENGIYLRDTGTFSNIVIRYNRIVDSVSTWNTGSLSVGGAGHGNGIQGGADGIEIYYNYLSNTDFRGIAISGDGVDIYNNVIYGSVANECLKISGGSNINIKNNIIQTDSNNEPLIYIVDGTTNVTISNNQYYTTGNGANAFVWLVTSYDYDEFAQWESASGDSNSTCGDPLFDDAGSNDFHLQSGSPCRDVGVDVSLTEDYDGVSVPQETNPAIGAFEYIVSGQTISSVGAIASAEAVGGTLLYRLNRLYAKGREAFLGGDIDWASDTIKAVLVDGADYTLDLAAHDFLSDIPSAAQVAISDALTGKSITLGIANAADLTVSAVSGDQFEYIILFKDTGDSTTSPLIMCIDSAVGLPFTPEGGSVKLKWSNLASKIFKL